MSATFDEPQGLTLTGLPRPTITLVIPAMNEAPNIPHVFAAIPSVVDEVILVDGASTDGTAETARRCRPDVRVVQQSGRGKGDALRCGFEAATGDIVVMADADGSTDLAEIPRFVEALMDGADFVKGSRYLPGGGSADITPLRRLGNSVLSQAVNVLYGTDYTDLCYGYNAFWLRCLRSLDVDCDGFEVETLLNIRAKRCGFTVTEVPSFEAPRLHGESNLHVVRDGLRVLRTIVRERFRYRSVIHLEDDGLLGGAALASELVAAELATTEVGAPEMAAG